MVTALSLHLWVIARTEVAARDSVGYIRYALRLEREPLLSVLKETEQPPGYAATVLVVSWPVRAWRGNSECDTMVLSCQLASAIMATLSIIPTVLLGREIGGRRVGWLAAGIVVCLPTWLRLTSDGLSEGTYLFWLATALWLGVRALRRPGVLVFAGCGLATGVAYLTRPEGLEVVVAFGCVLLCRQLVAAFRQPWPQAIAQASALAVGVLIFLGPYAATIGSLSNKNAVRGTLGEPLNDPDGLLPQYGYAGGPTLLAAWFHESGGVAPRWIWAAKSLAVETARAFDYVGLGLVALGLIVFRPRPGSGASRTALAVIVGLHALILCRMASLSGYLSERHALLFVIVGSFPAAAGIVWLGRFVPRASAGVVTASLMVAGLLVAGPALTKPLHYNRAGHKAAGRWLARTVTDGDAILDPFCWGEFYAGRIETRDTTDRPARLFVILEPGDNHHSRLPHIPAAKAAVQFGDLVYHWPENRSSDKAQVVVYEVKGSCLPDPAATDPRPRYRVTTSNPSAAVPPTARGGSG
jgi:hypothetical protein